ncbi:GNAT family N-acetyltransferase [Psychrosphaera sp. B3R10]|uniref:GNAT family N-acetyltransferase n=1 Tax=unclassified Psychrosphaera TaxID=2641570 RepID=UPI001C090DFB|nr:MULTISPECIES: GNAT family N-acetyltransferase [unclassified Psychrosphaera]MBU2880728.1 GNAT family N-acetyltransferase [Psychrosphaera sp. I2R16]MBU2991526.1 GNAT family N-acetyltransferase [Psychrosphaera sp. B3R10]
MKIDINADISLLSLTLDDAQTISILVNQNRDDLERFFPWAKNLHTREEAEAYISDRIFDEVNKGKWFVIKFRGVKSGIFGIKSIDKVNLTAELGYWLCAEARGRGVTNIIIKSLSGFLARSHLIETIVFRCLEKNSAGIRVIEKAGGELVDAIENDMDIEDKMQKINIYHLKIAE